MTDLLKKDNVDEDVKVQAYRICQDFLGSPWKDIDISQFKFSPLSGGLSNIVYLCSLPDTVVVKDPRTPSRVLYRIYGPMQEEDQDAIVTEATTFMLLAERKLGPKLYGVFPNGRLEEYIPSRSLKTVDYRPMSTTIAKEMAKIHALEVPVRKVPDLFTKYMERWLKDLAQNIALRPNETFENCDMYREEMEWLTDEMKKMNSPVVYCHNDLQGGNILLREDSSTVDDPKLMLIDFEFGAYNYRGFDIANQFCEWCFAYPTEKFPYFTWDFEDFPSIEEQTKYIRAYLDQHVEDGVIEKSSVERELVSILEEVKLFPMAVSLLWSLWSMKMSFLSLSSMVFSYREHGNVRIKAYWYFKEKYLNSRVSNGKAESSVH